MALDEKWSEIMPALKCAYNAVEEGRVSEEQFIVTMKTAIKLLFTFCKEPLHPGTQLYSD